jgi:proline iminopeptidase
MSLTEGRLEVEGGSIWYRLVGAGDDPPLVTLHGGPGYPSASLQPLEELGSGRTVVFYDQLGCGQSDRPDDPSLWTLERSIDELERLLEHLDLGRVHLLGHSWGTMLAVDFYLSHREAVRSMVLVSPALSAARWEQDSERLIARFPAELRAIHADHAASEEGIERLKAEYMARHFLRLEETPEPVKRAYEGFGPQVYNTMWGPNEFTPTGPLRDYERTDDLPSIDVPVLYTCGRHDSATPEATLFYASLTPGAQTHVFENSAHHAFLEDQESFLATTTRFLAGH